MARRTRVSCKRGQKRFTVLRVNNDDSDSHAGRSFAQALRLAMPDRGAKIDVFVVCADDAGEARLPSAYKRRGRLSRSFRYKRGG